VRAGPPRSSGLTRDRTAAVNANRAMRRSGLPPSGEKTGRVILQGIRIMM
jgi:hypothetical protein